MRGTKNVFVVVRLDDDLSDGDQEKVLAALSMVKGVASADWCDGAGSAAFYGAYHRIRRVYAEKMRAALGQAEEALTPRDGGIIQTPRPDRLP